jgi:predicted nucleotide-binding protein
MTTERRTGPRSPDELATTIILDLKAHFVEMGFNSSALSIGYVGVPLRQLNEKFCGGGGVSQVDFDLSLKELEEKGLIQTGPLVAHENDPNSGIFILGFYSKREYACLTEVGYKAPLATGDPKPLHSASQQWIENTNDVDRVERLREQTHMTPEKLVEELKAYEAKLGGIAERFIRKPGDYHILHSDDGSFREIAMTLYDLLRDTLGKQRYAQEVGAAYAEGLNNFTQSPSLHSVQEIIRILRVAITRIERNPQIVVQPSMAWNVPTQQRDPKKVFIIHGHDEAKRRELRALLSDRLGLKPVILSEQPDAGCSTLIEKFELYAPTCSYAIALFTPDDQVDLKGETYLQARPNVIYELGWFCAALSRKNVMLLLKVGTTVFSDFSGIVEKRFNEHISEKFIEIESDLKVSGMLS